jgi:hypothetical protein
MMDASNFELAESYAPASKQSASVRALIQNAEASRIRFETIRRPSKTLNSLLNRAESNDRQEQ